MITVEDTSGCGVLRVHRWPDDPSRIAVVLESAPHHRPLVSPGDDLRLQVIFEPSDILEMARRIIADLQPKACRVTGETL